MKHMESIKVKLIMKLISTIILLLIWKFGSLIIDKVNKKYLIETFRKKILGGEGLQVNTFCIEKPEPKPGPIL